MTLTPVQLLEGELDAIPHRIAGAIEAVAERSAALYVLDLEGRRLARVAGDVGLPEEVELPRRVGPVMFRGCADEVVETVASAGEGVVAHPLWLRGQTAVVAVTSGPPAQDLRDLLDAAAVALEVASQHTDVVLMARRTSYTTPAAELQQELLPPPIARAGDAELAGVILPAYRVGGDWFDWSYVRGELRFSIGDAVGRGETAMALGAAALSANRSARRRGEALAEAADCINRAVAELGEDLFVTVVLASWHHESSTVRWLRCGHLRPLHLRGDGTSVAVPTAGHLPLGAYDDELPELHVHETRLAPGDRFILSSDGITEARRADGSFFGEEGLREAVRDQARAPGTVRAVLSGLEDEVEELDDDATLVVLRRDAADE